MKTIEQEGVVDKKSSSGMSRSNFESDFFDDFQSGFSMYKGNSSNSSSREPVEAKTSDWGSFDSKDRSGGMKGWTDQEPRRAASPPRRSSPPRSTSSRPSREQAASGDEAQKKFGSAKAISSDQFFQDNNSNDVSTCFLYY